MKVVLTFLLFAAFAAQAQQRAQLTGVIRDSSGLGVPDTDVVMLNVETGIRRSTRTGEHGSYAVSSLAPGEYKVTVRKSGFRTIARTGIRLGATERARLDFLLEIGGMHEVVTVEGSASPIDTNDATSLVILKRDDIDGLPLNSRGVQGALDFIPGLLFTPASRGEAGQFTANGQRPNTNYFTVDGVSANNGISGSGLPGDFSGGALPGMTAIGSLHGLVTSLALEEVRVQTSTFAPEFGRLPGAQIAVITRSGSNNFHGEFFGALRRGRLNAGDWFANRAGLDRSGADADSAGGVFSGPVLRNRTFFAAAIERLHLNQSAAWRMAVPSTEERRDAPVARRPVLDAFPLPSSPLEAEHTAQTRWPGDVLTNSVRVDHAFSSNGLAFLRWTRTPSNSRFGYLQVNEAQLDSTGVTAGLLMSSGPRLTNDARINLSRATADSRWSAPGLGGAQPLDLASVLPPLPGTGRGVYALSIAGLGPLLAAEPARNRQTELNLIDTIAVHSGNHQAKFGIDYHRLVSTRAEPISGVIASYASLPDFIGGAEPAVDFLQAASGSSVIETFSLFAQDTWQLGSRLNFTFGTRWEITPAPTYRSPSGTSAIRLITGEIPPRERPDPGEPAPFPAGTAAVPSWKTRYGQFAPRAGVALRLDEEGSLIFRAGSGLFYDLGFSSVADVLNGAPFNRWIVNLTAGAPGSGQREVLYGFAQDLKLPYSVHWNIAIEKLLNRRTAVSAAYVGSPARRLLRLERRPATVADQPGSVLANNGGSSQYHSLQLQARRSVARGLNGFAAYTWGHSIDNASWNSAIFFLYPGATDRGSSDFDVRHSFQTGLSYNLNSSAMGRWTRGWTVSTIFRARTGFPIDVVARENPFGLGSDNARPDLVGGIPVWIRDPSVPAGRRLNRDAFRIPAPGLQGSLGRNAVRGFGLAQIDASLERRFTIGEAAALGIRLEAYNVMNRPNFADPMRFLNNPLFGQSLSQANLMLGTGRAHSGLTPNFQSGGPRSLQLRIDVQF